MKTVYSGNVEVKVFNLSNWATGNYTYEVQEYAPIDPMHPDHLSLEYKTIYTGTCFLIQGTQTKLFNITDIVAERREHYEDIIWESDVQYPYLVKRVNLLNYYRVAISGGGNYQQSEDVQVIFADRYPNFTQDMIPIEDTNEYLGYWDCVLLAPLIQGVKDRTGQLGPVIEPILTPHFPLSNYIYPLVGMCSRGYNRAPMYLNFEGFADYKADTSQLIKLAPVFDTYIDFSKASIGMHSKYVNPTNNFGLAAISNMEETFSSMPYRNFNWSAQTGSTYYLSIYLTDGSTRWTIEDNVELTGAPQKFNIDLTASSPKYYLYNHDNVVLRCEITSPDDTTKSMDLACAFIKATWPDTVNNYVRIYLTIEALRGAYIQFDASHMRLAGNQEFLTTEYWLEDADPTILLETYEAVPTEYARYYDSEYWEVTGYNGNYTISDIDYGNTFTVSIVIKENGTEFSFVLKSNVTDFTIDTTDQDTYNILSRIKQFYPNATVYFRVKTFDTQLGPEPYVDFDITDLLLWLRRGEIFYITFSTYEYASSQGTKLKIELKFLMAAEPHKYKIGDIDLCPARYYLMWQDRFGGFQCQPFEKTAIFQEDFKRHEWATYQNAKRLGGIEVQPKWKLNTGWIKDELYPYYESILISPYILLIDTEKNETTRVLVNDSNYTEKTFKNQNRQLFNLELTVSQDKPQQILY